jgi:ankyrin repeat protein
MRKGLLRRADAAAVLCDQAETWRVGSTAGNSGRNGVTSGGSFEVERDLLREIKSAVPGAIYNNVKTLPSRTTMNGAAVMLHAVRDGDLSAVKRLLSEDPALVRATDDHLKTPLHWAAEHDHHEVATLLLYAGADVEATTSWGATPLDWAATMGSSKVADLLLARGAQGMNLVAAASLGKLGLIRAFLDSGTPLTSLARRAIPAEPNEHWVADSACMKGDVISDAFYGACRNGHTAVAALLLERGADVNAKGVFGGTGLHWAAINGHKDTVAFLVVHGADLTVRDTKFHSTPEGWAAEGQHNEIRELLHRS